MIAQIQTNAIKEVVLMHVFLQNVVRLQDVKQLCMIQSAYVLKVILEIH